MNIIQIQDRLKGLPEDALVNYVKNPMGEVPIYLALGEMQRRKDMKARFDASKPEEPSVAEKLVAETGIAAMAPQGMMPQGQGVGTPSSAPQIDPRQMAASGIAANPVNNVGKYAEGGIVGYKFGDIVKKAKDSEGLKKLKEFILGRKGKDAVKGKADYKSGVGPLKENYIPGSDAVPAVKNFARRNKLTTAGLAGYGGLTGYDAIFGEDGSLDNLPEKGTSEEELQNAIDALNKPKKEAGDKPKLTEKQNLKNRTKELQELFGVDEGREKIAAKLAKKEKNSLNMALINAGLGMAGGKSANFLENLTAGAGAGLESYTNTQADIFEIETELAKADRSERIAIIGQALEDGRIDKKMANALAVANIQGPTVSPQAGPAAKEVADINKEIRSLQVAMEKQISDGNTDAAAKIRTMILNRIKVKNQAVKDSVSLSTDPGTYSAGTGATNDPVNIR